MNRQQIEFAIKVSEKVSKVLDKRVADMSFELANIYKSEGHDIIIHPDFYRRVIMTAVCDLLANDFIIIKEKNENNKTVDPK